MSLSRESDEERQEALAIPHQQLSREALRGVIEAFVLREGTDYGETHHSLEDKVQQVLRQLERNEAHIVFDPNTESVDIVVSQTPRRRPFSA